MGPTTPNCPTGHPGGKRIRRHHHTVSANNIHPLLPQPAQRNRAAGEFRPDLHREKSLPEKYFYQALLQIHILYIPDPDSPTGLSPIITPQSSDGSAISNQHAMRVQVLLAMGKYCLFKEEAGELLDQRFHVVTTTQELHHSMRNIVRLIGDYLGDEGPLRWAMATWPRHIDRFDRK